MVKFIQCVCGAGPSDMTIQEAYGIRSLMFARGAMWDPSIFAHKKAYEAGATAGCSFSRSEVLKDYIKRVCCV